MVRAQQATNSSPTPSATPAQPPPCGGKERTRAVSGQVSAGGGCAGAGIRRCAKERRGKARADRSGAARGAAPPPVSPEVPRSFDAKRDVALNATGCGGRAVEPRMGGEPQCSLRPARMAGWCTPTAVGLPVVVCAPLHVCILELEPGEKIVGEPHIGDSIRWEISPSVSGSGPDATPLIIIKPRIAGLDTTMVVPTDRRAYYVRLESKPNEYVARVAFSYPEDTKQKWQEYLAKQREAEQQEKAAAERVAELPNTALENMYWNYEIKGGDASTRPMHVMDDGAKTYIQMPIETIHRELPVLVVKGPNGSEMVNYRVKDNMYIVDRLFDRAALLLGSGKHQAKVELIRKAEVERWKGTGASTASPASVKRCGSRSTAMTDVETTNGIAFGFGAAS